MHRIVSLLSSSTEIVAILGCLDQLVGRSHECDFPPEVLGLPVCSQAKIDPSASSIAIDTQVKTLAAGQLSIYEVDGEMIRSLQPDVILTQTLCDVCAVSDRDVIEALGAAGLPGARIVSLRPQTLAETWNDIETVADALGVSERGRDIVAALQSRWNALIKRAACRPSVRVACIEWLAPLMSAGNWVPELVEAAGGIPVVGTAGQHSPWLTWEALIAADPDVIVLMPCGFDLERTCVETDQVLAADSRWMALRAVQSGRAFAVDGNQYFNRPGPRLVDSAEILEVIINDPVERVGTGWRRL